MGRKALHCWEFGPLLLLAARVFSGLDFECLEHRGVASRDFKFVDFVRESRGRILSTRAKSVLSCCKS